VGKSNDLKDLVYDVAAGGDTFAQTTCKIAEYVARKYKDASKFRKGMVNMFLPNIDKPKILDQHASPMQIKMWEMDLKEYKQKMEAW